MQGNADYPYSADMGSTYVPDDYVPYEELDAPSAPAADRTASAPAPAGDAPNSAPAADSADIQAILQAGFGDGVVWHVLRKR